MDSIDTLLENNLLIWIPTNYRLDNTICSFSYGTNNRCRKQILRPSTLCAKHLTVMRKYICKACKKKNILSSEQYEKWRDELLVYLTRNNGEYEFCPNHWNEFKNLARDVEIRYCLGEMHYTEYMYSRDTNVSLLCKQETLPGKPYCMYHMETNGHP